MRHAFRAVRAWLFERGLAVPTLVIALLVTAISLWLLWGLERPEPVAAAFTRVGGTTRVETSVDASRFWISRRHSVVAIRSNAPLKERQRATECAMLNDVPLVFTRPNGNPPTHTQTWDGQCLK